MSLLYIRSEAARGSLRLNIVIKRLRILLIVRLCCVATSLLCSGCAPWVKDDIENINNSKFLKGIGFLKHINGQFQEFFSPNDPQHPTRETLSTIEDADMFLEKMGSTKSLSNQAIDFLEKDGFDCALQVCTREFSIVRSYGSAFLATPQLFSQEGKYIRSWTFVISKNNMGGHFVRLSYKEAQK